MKGFRFNPPSGWPPAPAGWTPPPDWRPPPEWPPAPPGWQFWIIDEGQAEAPIVRHHASDASEVRAAPDNASVSRAHGGDSADPERPTGETEPSSLGIPNREPALSPPKTAAAVTEPMNEEHEAALEADPSFRPGLETAGRPSPPSEQNPELARLVRQRDALSKEVQRLRSRLEGIDALAEVGIYQFRHPLDSSAEYKSELERLRAQIKDIVRRGDAIEASDMFAYNNSLAQGRRMVGDLSKLMLRAYNAEAENCVRTVRAGSVATAVARLSRAVDAIAKLGKMMEMRVSPEFHALRVREIELTGDFLMKLQIEREEVREERERLREERKAEMELAAARERLEKERAHYSNALAALIAQGKTKEADDLQERLGDIDRAIEENDHRAANIRAGYVYVISNIGAFGGDVVKIGMTRRLEPLDRIRELGDASVPFPFDVHAIYFSDDAVGLESALHKAFANHRLNQVNLRREFFYATPQEVKEVLATQVGSLLEFTEEPDAEQYRQSVSIRAVLQGVESRRPTD